MSREQARSLRAELERLDESISRHQALVVIQQMEELDRVMRWYGQNAAEVLRTINSLNTGLGVLLLAQEEVPFGDDEHRDYITELGRTWHNWVASANTVADHMRQQFKEQPPDLQEEYEQKKHRAARRGGVHLPLTQRPAAPRGFQHRRDVEVHADERALRGELSNRHPPQQVRRVVEPGLTSIHRV